MSATPHEQEKQLADDYLNGAILARTLSEKALQLALKQIEDGTLRDPAKTAMNAAITSGTLLDKRLLLEGRPTQIHATDPLAEIRAMAREFNITIESTATDITSTPIPQSYPKRDAEPNAHQAAETKAVPLLPEGVEAKRASASN